MSHQFESGLRSLKDAFSSCDFFYYYYYSNRSQICTSTSISFYTRARTTVRSGCSFNTALTGQLLVSGKWSLVIWQSVVAVTTVVPGDGPAGTFVTATIIGMSSDVFRGGTEGVIFSGGNFLGAASLLTLSVFFC